MPDASVPYDDQDWLPRAAGPRVRGGEDIAANLTGGAIGGLATITESLFDGFFGQPVTPHPQEPARRRAEPESDRPARNVFAEAAAQEARRRAELDAEKDRDADEWWDERRARTRD